MVRERIKPRLERGGAQGKSFGRRPIEGRRCFRLLVDRRPRPRAARGRYRRHRARRAMYAVLTRIGSGIEARWSKLKRAA
jgi:hypothetical protein